MGNLLVGRTMEESQKKQQEFMKEMNRITVERQIQMQNAMRERMVALQIAQAREMFVWLASFYVIAGTAMIAGFRRTRRPGLIAPMLPLTFIVAYQADLAYGTKINRVKAEAENILMFERDLIEIPSGLPTVSSLDIGRLQMLEDAKYKVATPSMQN